MKLVHNVASSMWGGGGGLNNIGICHGKVDPSDVTLP